MKQMDIITITPFFGIIIGFISSVLLVIGSVWFSRANKPDERFNCPLAAGIRALIFSVLTYYALLMFDVIIKVGFLGLVGYGNIQYHIAGLILFGILGTVILIGTVFTAPTVKTIITFILDMGIYIYYLWFNFAEGFSDSEYAFIWVPIPYFLAVPFIIEILWILIRTITKKRPVFEEKLLWDNTQKFKKRINIRFYIIILALFYAEFILNFEGISMLFWI
jgi:hypothetical protein